MTDQRRAQLKAITKEHVLGHMKLYGVGYRKAARHFAGDAGTEEDIKYLTGRFRRWSHKAKHADDATSTSTATTATAPTATATAPAAPIDPNAPVPGSLADLAVEGDLEAFLVARIRQIENSVARFATTSSNAAAVATLGRLGNQVRAELEKLRKETDGDIGTLPPEERARLLAVSAPAWPDEALRAGAWVWFEKGCP